MKIAVDAMGGDYAPEAIVEGAVQAAEEYDFSLILVGQEELVHQELSKYKTDRLSIEVRHAPQVVDMQDLPSVALRRKKDSSLHIAINMIKHGEADAAVSAGNTGAAMAIGKVACRMLEGIERPALATVLPNIDGITVLIDVGANVDCKPLHLLQFAVMGHVYAQEVFSISNPRIGLLSIGEESSKGNVLTKEVFESLSQSELNFLGNAEGRDAFNGRVDVIVCDGFIGNVVLKVSESLAKTMGLLLKDVFTQNWRTKLGYLLVKPGMGAMRKRVDYSEYGGAPLLGLNGVVIVSHGSSKATAIKNAIRVAGESVDHRINDQIIETMFNCEFDVKSQSRATSLWRQITRSIRHENHKEKTELEKQEETHLKEQEQQPEPSSTTQEDPQEHYEASKKSWWPLKQSGEPLKEEPRIDTEQVVGLSEQIQEAQYLEEEFPSEQSQKKEKQNEVELEKKHWWHLKQRNEHQQEESPADAFSATAKSQSPQQLQLPEPEQPKVAEPAQGVELLKEPDSAPSKRAWWKRKETAYQKNEKEQTPSSDEAKEAVKRHPSPSQEEKPPQSQP